MTENITRISRTAEQAMAFRAVIGGLSGLALICDGTDVRQSTTALYCGNPYLLFERSPFTIGSTPIAPANELNRA